MNHKLINGTEHPYYLINYFLVLSTNMWWKTIGLLSKRQLKPLIYILILQTQTIIIIYNM